MPKVHPVQKMRRFHQFTSEPPHFDLARNDADYSGQGAHTLDRHGPGIPLRRAKGTKTVEGRLFGDPPWSNRVTRSYQWIDMPTLNCTINAYVSRNWSAIRDDLASRFRHEGTANAGHPIGRGYDSHGIPGMRSGRPHYREVSWFVVRIRLDSNAEQPTPFIVSAFPSSRPPY